MGRGALRVPERDDFPFADGIPGVIPAQAGRLRKCTKLRGREVFWCSADLVGDGSACRTAAGLDCAISWLRREQGSNPSTPQEQQVCCVRDPYSACAAGRMTV